VIRQAWAWWRRRRQLVDFLWMSPLLAVSLLMLPSFTDPGAESGPVLMPGRYVLLTLCLCLPLTFRRRWPLTVFATISLFAFAQWLAGAHLIPADLAVPIVLYTVAVECSFRWGVAAALIVGFGAVLQALHQADTWKERRSLLELFGVFIGGIWILGIYINTRRAYLRSLEERAARLERERDIEVQIATAAERARIARELHDVVAHSVSVIVVQADGAGYTIDTEPERAKRALETISLTGRQALTEMRRLLGVLREGGDPDGYAPQPGIEQLTDLVDQVRSSGLPLEFSVEGVPQPLPAGLQLTVFRIAQEALTNTLKHAGQAATARLRLHYGDHAVEVTIDDDGRGSAVVGDGRGLGLAGMRERVAMYGGNVQAGPKSGGGFEVVARLPIREGVTA
jgi:signal transduction histidine kinase